MSDDFVERLVAATPRTWVTRLLIALNVLVWVANVATGVSPMDPDPRALLAWGGNLLPLTEHEPWRLLAATFLHGGIVHLAFNMWALWQTGPLAERFYGNLQFLALYIASGVFGSLASLFFSAREAVSVGASGAIFGVVGALLAAIITKHHHLPPGLATSLRNSLLFFAGYSLFMGFTVAHIDNAAHIGGLACGFLMGTVMAERFDWQQYQAQGMPRAAAALAAAMVIGFVAWKMVPTGAM